MKQEGVIYYEMADGKITRVDVGEGQTGVFK